jgi:hypothetical protein
VTPAPGPSLTPPPDVARTAHDDGQGLRAPRRVTLTVVVVIALLVAGPAVALSGHLRTEWSLAFGATTTVEATVTGSSPSLQPSRTCSLTNIDVVWTAPVGTHAGSFTVCDGQAGQFAVGTAVRVAVVPGDRSVIQGEGRGSAIAGVAIEAFFLLLFLLLLAAGLRHWWQLATASRRFRTAPWLPGTICPAPPGRAVGQPVLVIPPAGAVPWTRPPTAKGRRRTCLADDVPARVGQAAEHSGLDPRAALRLNVQRRRDQARLAEADQVWLAPTGRTLNGHRRSGPYAIIRAADRRVFWATAPPLPGSHW